jgi:hypothetical protein
MGTRNGRASIARNGRASITRSCNAGLAFAVRVWEKEPKPGRAKDRNQRMARPGALTARWRVAREERGKCITACELATSDVLAEWPTGRWERQS